MAVSRPSWTSMRPGNDSPIRFQNLLKRTRSDLCLPKTANMVRSSYSVITEPF